ncbi:MULTISPECIES: FkbM family methyltransferase [unclassified Mesorhizobium]|uniref:FkbM family methyltransferase n=1 Tax=unclassified Mesorhizobium TaxID=325217 RepID=UPI000FD3887E|nr:MULTISPECIES: FkbM family methyltransferase [unclassified Mesorhizobium]RVB80568.1 FkbM family methyltransferase [Mesorhizobium sp. M6A.T.Cr.TU.014.01.1.1]RWP97573.1 MAG: FkbM family methyltransferase [Mesorhizobium sp.]RWQ10846.1 MAG: FkbM family methyltransferase [Mesorhizobium sp.]
MFKAVKRIARSILWPPMHEVDFRGQMIFLGNEYGGWPLLCDCVDKGSVIYSFGIGEDISFDRAVIERYGCRVFGFDPTPKSRAWLDMQNLPNEFVFHPIGIAAKDGEAEFFPPPVEGHVSFSVTPQRKGSHGSSVKAPVLRLESIMSQIGLPEPTILKMDIEGFEYDVISDILAGPVRPLQLLIEFHHGMYDGFGAERTMGAVDALRAAGYRLFYTSRTGREYAFVRSLL